MHGFDFWEFVPKTKIPVLATLYLNLGTAFEGLETAALKFQSQAVLTLAYEGGHPDHDCCSFLSHLIAKAHNLPVWEMPLYHRTSHGSKHQQFVEGTGETQRLQITAGELVKKRKMVGEYASQADCSRGSTWIWNCSGRS